MDECINSWMNEWRNGWMNEWINKWMNEWMNEWISKKMNELTLDATVGVLSAMAKTSWSHIEETIESLAAKCLGRSS